MRIIDSNKDYYDYLQGVYRDDTVVFDRRGSYRYTREEFMRELFLFVNYEEPFLLLQVCNNFWLFKGKECDNDSKTNYGLEFLDRWDDYDCDSKLIELSTVSFPYYIKDYRGAIKRKEYKVEHLFGCTTEWGYSKKGKRSVISKTYHVPILKDTGLTAFIDAQDIYFAFEEYFLMQKTKAEKTVADGTTNENKIVSHGFNLKDSFRG